MAYARSPMLGPRTLVMILGVTTLGCGSEPRSCDLDTDAIIMWATVNDVGETIEVEVEFEAAGAEGAALALCPDRDRLLIDGVEPSLVSALDHVVYEAELDSTSDRELEIQLERVDRQSVSVTIELPPTLEVLSPTANSSHSRAAPLEVGWDPPWSGELIELTIEDQVGSECIDDGVAIAYEVEDTGSYTIGAFSLASAAGGSCEVELTLTRSVEFEYPAELHEGGRISGFVRRRQPFTSSE